MNKSRELLEKELSAALNQNLDRKKEIQKLIKKARDEFAMPEKTSSDFLTMRKNIIEADVFTLFILTSIVLGPKKTNEYFTNVEVRELSKAKWHIEKVEFPLKFDMVKITDEQYIGHISVKELMLLKEAQLINYNENAQRTMKHIVRGEMEYYQIALNKEAVRAIMDSYGSDLYIPNTITLNLPEEASYIYDEKKHQLIIRETEYLDILDGYHRYIAMSKESSQYPDFDYEMELRIVQFTEDKARRFIWQEDQKTKMRKIDSDSMDSAKISNKIVERINNDSSFILSGNISRNKGIINAAYLANIIDIMYLKGIKKSEERIEIKRISSQIIAMIEEFTDLCPQYLQEPWTKELLFTVCYEGKYGDVKDTLRDLVKIVNSGDIYKSAKITQADITRTHKLLRKEGY